MASSSKRRKSSPQKASASIDTSNYDFTYLKGVKAFIVEQSLGKTRANILANQLIKHSGERHTKLQDDTTHLLIDNGMRIERLKKILKKDSFRQSLIIARADWLSDCLTNAELLDVSTYLVDDSDEKNFSDMVKIKPALSTFADSTNNITGCETNDEDDKRVSFPSSSGTATEGSHLKSGWWKEPKRKLDKCQDSDNDSEYVDSGDEAVKESNKDNQAAVEISPHVSPKELGGQWICTQASDAVGSNHNKHVTDKLEILANAYKNTSDRWRAMTYNKAIASIKSHPKPLETYEEVKSLPFVGEKLADKIWEILQTGHLRRLDHMDPNLQTIELFTNIWGAGPKAAETWVLQGLKTLEDVKEHGNPTKQQIIGLQYYDEFVERMTRSEVEEIEVEVKTALQNINPYLECVTCGSYRRGQKTCGDIDLLISHPDGRSHKGVMDKLLRTLKEKGFLTDDLVLANNGEQKKYLGVCKLPGQDRKHRRIDIIVVPYTEWACGLVYFTGSAYLNRSMRLLAHKKNMSLNEHSLNTGVIRKGKEKITEGTPVPVFSEKDIFQYLGLDYLEPHQRDW